MSYSKVMNTPTSLSRAASSLHARRLSPPRLEKAEPTINQPTEKFEAARDKSSNPTNIWKIVALGGLAVGALTGCTDSVPDPVVELTGAQVTDLEGRTLYADEGVDLTADGTYMVGTHRGLREGEWGSHSEWSYPLCR